MLNGLTARLCPDQAAKKKWWIGGGVAGGLLIIIIIIVATTAGGNSKFTSRDVLTQYPLIDGHNHFVDYVSTKFRFQLNTTFQFNSTLSGTATDLPRLRTGLVGGLILTAAPPCSSQFKDAVVRVFEQIDAIKRIVKSNEDLQLALTVKDVRDAFLEKRIAVMMSVEGGYAIDSRLSVLRSFYELGVRSMTLVRNCHVPWAEASIGDDATPTVSPAGPGLTAWGKRVVLEMNRLGMVVDLTHASKKTVLDTLATTKAPVIFSHSAAAAVAPIPGNVPNEILEALKLNDGVVMINLAKDALAPGADATNVDTVVQHLEHIRNVTKTSHHVGIGSNFDGSEEKFPVGLEDVSKYPALFDKLIEKGWTRDDLGNLAGGNVLRIIARAEAISKQSEAVPADDTPIDVADLVKFTKVGECRSDDIIPPTPAST